MIFHFAKSDPEYESDPIRVYNQNLFVICLSAVCRHWRRTAIGDGTLWGNISFSPSLLSTINCAAEFLRRSRRAPLALMIWNADRLTTPAVVENPAMTNMLNELGRNVARITDLVAINPPGVVMGVLTQPATSLVRLNIQTVESGVFASLFGGVMPKLEHLSISNPIGWKIQLFQNLNTVHLTATPLRRWRLSSLLDCIYAPVAIKELHLTCFEDFEPETVAESRRTVSLSSLHILRFTFCDSALMLSHMEIPPSTALSIYGHFGHSENILTCLPESGHFPGVLKGSKYLTVVFDVEREIFEVDILGPKGIQLLLGAVPRQGVFDRKWVLRSMIAVTHFAPVSGVKWLTVVVDEYRMPWKAWLSRFGQISTLEVRCPDPAELLGVLIAPKSTGQILCPALRALSVERIKRPTADSRLLRECLETRASAGTAISSLNLNEMDWTAIPPAEIDAWEELIGRTRLDGRCSPLWFPYFFSQRRVAVTTGSFAQREDLLLDS